MRSYVLDSYAVLTYFQNEAGAEQVERLLAEAESESVNLLLSVVNLGETVYITQRKAGPEIKDSLLMALETLPVQLVEVTKDIALRAAEIKAGYPLAYADCFAAALGLVKGVPVVTGDPEFKKIENLITVEWLPHNREK